MLTKTSNFYKASTDLLKSYHWDILYKNIIDEKIYFHLNELEKEQATFLKVLLLSTWWQEHTLAKTILLKYPKEKSDYLIYFATTLAWISIGDKDYINYYLKNKPNKLPDWMQNWLSIEFYGRSKQDKKQIQKVRKIIKPTKVLPNWIKVALIQSSNRQEIDISYLKDYLEEMDFCKSKDILDIELCIIAKKIMPSKDKCNINSFLLLNSYAKYLLNNHEVIDALNAYDNLAKTKFLDLNAIDKWLAISTSLPNGLNMLAKKVEFALTLVPDTLDIKRIAISYGLIEAWSSGKFIYAYNLAKEFYRYHKLPLSNLTKNSQVFFIYVLKLCTIWQNNRIYYDHIPKYDSARPLIILGESHSLSPANLYFEFNGKLKKGKNAFIAGIKMYNLVYPDASYYTNCLIEHIKTLPINCDILICIGEIDTRPNEGIWKVHLEKNKDLNEIIEDTVHGYINFLCINLKDKYLNSVTIQGVPAPGYTLEGDKDPGDKSGFLEMIKKVNYRLKDVALEKGWNFLDVYNATVNSEGVSNLKWHIDDYHLSPLFYHEADKWLIKPKVQAKPTTIDFSNYKTVSLSKPS